VTNIRDGANYAPSGTATRVVGRNEFCFAAAYLDHGHIYGQVNGLLEAGGTLKYVYEPDPEKLRRFCQTFAEVTAVSDFQQILDAPDIHLVCAAAIPSQRAGIGIQVLESGKDYFTDKAPCTTLEQLSRVRKCVERTGGRYWVYYAERIHNDAAWRAGELIGHGAVGKVLQVLNLAPHRLNKRSRPNWFFEKRHYGGILADLGSHQVEQFLAYTGSRSATINYARVDNFSHPELHEFEDFGEVSMTGDTGASFYARVDWHTPEGLRTWGDGRTFILGTEGTLELRKYIDVAERAPASRLLLVNSEGEFSEDCLHRSGFPFFGLLILDCLERTETAVSQQQVFLAAELSLKAQNIADEIRRGRA
jgi:predicted dehydrogenase